MLELLFLLIALGTPAAICIVAVIGAYFNDSDDLTVLDTQPARSPSQELQYRHREIEEMLDAVNRRRRERGAPEQTLQQLSPKRNHRRI